MIKNIEMTMKGINFNLPLKPITLIFGPNSSGKSSVIHGLLFLHHALNTGEVDFRYPKLSGSLVDLGGIGRSMNGYIEDINIYVNVNDLPESIKKYFVKDSIIYLHFGFNNYLLLDIFEIVDLIEPIPNEYLIDGRPDPEKYTYWRDSHEKVLDYDKLGDDFYKTGNFYALISYVSEEDRLNCDTFIIPNLLSEILHTSIIQLVTKKYPSIVDLLSKRNFKKLWLFGPKFGNLLNEIYSKQFLLDSNCEIIKDPYGKPIKNNYELSYEEKIILENEKLIRSYVDLYSRALLPDHPEHSEYLLVDKQIACLLDRVFPEGIITRGLNFHTKNLMPIPEQNVSVNVEKILHTLLSNDIDSEKAIKSILEQIASKSFCDCLKGIADSVLEDINRLRYLGPIRAYPDRLVGVEHEKESTWYSSGNYAWQEIKENPKVREKVNEWLGSAKRLKTPYEFLVREYFHGTEDLKRLIEYGLNINLPSKLFANLKSIEQNIYPIIYDTAEQVSQFVAHNMKSSTIRTLALIDKRRNIEVTHRDVGFGISQILPVLVEAFGNQNKIIAIEQPELHLHPGMQAELGDVFIESALGENKNRFVLETHSEHLILRILRRIRETTMGELPEGMNPITPDDLCVLYAKPTDEGSELIELRVDKMGEFIDRWPEGFFTERAEELF